MSRKQSIVLRDMTFPAPIDQDSWGRGSKAAQPIVCSVALEYERAVPAAGGAASDEVDIDYSRLSELVLRHAHSPLAAIGSLARSEPARYSVGEFHEAVAIAAHIRWAQVTTVKVQTTLPLGFSGARAVAVWSSQLDVASHTHHMTLELRDILANTIIGLRPREKEHKQTVLTSLRVALIMPWRSTGLLEEALPHKLAVEVIHVVETSQNETVEGLFEDLVATFARLRPAAERLGPNPFQPSLKWLRVVKTDAIPFVGGAGVEAEFAD